MKPTEALLKDRSIATNRLDRVAKKLGFQSYRDYNKFFISRLGASSQSEYQSLLARKKGLRTPTQYLNHLKAIRSQNPQYKKLANLIRKQLSALGLTQSDLARRTRIDRGLIFQYVHGFSYPKPNRLSKIFEALQIHHAKPLMGRRHIFGTVQLQKPRHQKYSELSNSISYFLSKFGKDRQWLAKVTRIPQQHVTLYLNGLIYPKPDRLRRIIHVFESLDARKLKRSSK